MKYYNFLLNQESGEEGDKFKYKERKECTICGLKYLDFIKDFPTPEDSIEILNIRLYKKPAIPIFFATGCLFSSEEIADEMIENGFTGFIKLSSILTIDEIDFANFVCLQITGRCKTNDIWDRVISTCSKCNESEIQSIYSQTRETKLLSLPDSDFNRARERMAGIIISYRIKEYLINKFQDNTSLFKFNEIKIEA